MKEAKLQNRTLAEAAISGLLSQPPNERHCCYPCAAALCSVPSNQNGSFKCHTDGVTPLPAPLVQCFSAERICRGQFWLPQLGGTRGLLLEFSGLRPAVVFSNPQCTTEFSRAAVGKPCSCNISSRPSCSSGLCVTSLGSLGHVQPLFLVNAAPARLTSWCFQG